MFARSGILVSAVILGLCIASCDSAAPTDPEGAMAGIEVRDEMNIMIGTLGDPEPITGPANGPVHLEAPFPNPGYPWTTLTYLVQQASAVEIWIDRVEPTSEFHQLISSRIPALPQGTAERVRQLREAESTSEGMHQVSWDGTDDDGEALGRGYFRAYLSADGALYGHDFLIVGSSEEWDALAGAAKR